MCIIVAKEKGVKMPSKSILKNCFDYNDDGAGLMYVQNGKVIIDKGYMNFKDFYKRIKKIKKRLNSDLTNKAIVFHFRIGTSGENDKATTHPFPVSKNASDLRKTYFKTDLGMAHNGIIHNFVYGQDLSDTQNFVKDFISVFKELDKKFFLNERVMNLIEKEADSKICFLDNRENIYYIGNFIEDKGVKYSNASYKENIYASYKSSYTTTNTSSKDTLTKNDYDNYDLEDFVKSKIEYEVLEKGDYYECDYYSAEVMENEILIVDRDYNLYEVLTDLENNSYLSLIGEDVVVYDKDFMLKRFNWEFGDYEECEE